MADCHFSRRSFLKSSAVGTARLMAPALLPAPGADAAQTDVLDHLGVALYTVRDQMKTDAAGTLKAIADLGYRYVESALVVRSTHGVGKSAGHFGDVPVV
jgi:hypothetical protein